METQTTGLKIKKRLSATNFLAKVLDVISKGKHAISTQVITLRIDNAVARNLDVPTHIALHLKSFEILAPLLKL